jgi:hypothetical protein
MRRQGVWDEDPQKMVYGKVEADVSQVEHKAA